MLVAFLSFMQLFGGLSSSEAAMSSPEATSTPTLPREALRGDIMTTLKDADVLTFQILDEVRGNGIVRIAYRVSYLPRTGARMITRFEAVATYRSIGRAEWKLVDVAPRTSEAQFVDASVVTATR